MKVLPLALQFTNVHVQKPARSQQQCPSHQWLRRTDRHRGLREGERGRSRRLSYPLHPDAATLQGVSNKRRLLGQCGAVTVTPIQLRETHQGSYRRSKCITRHAGAGRVASRTRRSPSLLRMRCESLPPPPPPPRPCRWVSFPLPFLSRGLFSKLPAATCCACGTSLGPSNEDVGQEHPPAHHRREAWDLPKVGALVAAQEGGHGQWDSRTQRPLDRAKAYGQ